MGCPRPALPWALLAFGEPCGSLSGAVVHTPGRVTASLVSANRVRVTNVFSHDSTGHRTRIGRVPATNARRRCSSMRLRRNPSLWFKPLLSQRDAVVKILPIRTSTPFDRKRWILLVPRFRRHSGDVSSRNVRVTFLTRKTVIPTISGISSWAAFCTELTHLLFRRQPCGQFLEPLRWVLLRTCA